MSAITIEQQVSPGWVQPTLPIYDLQPPVLPAHYRTTGGTTWVCIEPDCDGEHHVWCSCHARSHTV